MLAYNNLIAYPFRMKNHIVGYEPGDTESQVQAIAKTGIAMAAGSYALFTELFYTPFGSELLRLGVEGIGIYAVASFVQRRLTGTDTGPE
jgi:hypothetical protein